MSPPPCCRAAGVSFIPSSKGYANVDAIPVLKISGTVALIIVLYTVVLFGTAHLLALSKPQSKLSQAWILLGF